VLSQIIALHESGGLEEAHPQMSTLLDTLGGANLMEEFGIDG
jgi:hypothetical protein